MKTFFRIVFYFITFIAVGAIAAWLVYEMFDFEDRRDVPELIGRSIEEAEKLLEERNLFLVIKDEQYSEEISAGHVVSQDTSPGEKVMLGTEISVVVSKGSEIYSMPSFEGQLLDDAKLTMKNLGIKLKKVTMVHSDEIEKGKIIAQRPLPGNIEGNEINFLVSLGPYETSYRCPSFINMTVADARELADKLGIRLIEKESGSRVIFQKPEAGAIIKRGDEVEVQLGRGWGMWF